MSYVIQAGLTPLEDRCTPAFTVNSINWNASQAGTLPWAIASANAANGQDEILFDWTALGNNPSFAVPADEGVEVTDGVIIRAGWGNVYATFTGSTPFFFTHTKPEGSTESVINSGVFDGCSGVGSAHGGAISVTGGTLSLNYNKFLDNQADFGGAISVTAGATLLIGGETGFAPQPDDHPEVGANPHVLFKGNTATMNGGAIQVDGGVVKIQRAFFSANKAGADGGGINLTNDGTLHAGPTAISGPTSPPGGTSPGGSTTVNVPGLSDVTFSLNRAQNGGAVNHHSTSKSTFANVMFAGNKAVTDGGAINSYGNLTITDGSVIGNTAGGKGGGLRVLQGTVDITGTTVQENTAGGVGGGIAVGDIIGVAAVNATNVAFVSNMSAVPGTWHVVALFGAPFNDTNCTYQ